MDRVSHLLSTRLPRGTAAVGVCWKGTPRAVESLQKALCQAWDPGAHCRWAGLGAVAELADATCQMGAPGGDCRHLGLRE